MTRFAGSGIDTDNGVSEATSTNLKLPFSVFIDTNGLFYVAEVFGRVLRMSTTGSTALTAIAGVYDAGSFSGDGGSATSAQFEAEIPFLTQNPATGDLFISQATYIRMIDGATNIIDTIAGIPGSSGFSGDNGPAISAQFDNIYQITFRNNKLFLADYNNGVIRTIYTPSLTTEAPSAEPSVVPSVVPSAEPSVVPTAVPSAEPSVVPSAVPSAEPSVLPSEVPSEVPSVVPSEVPSEVPSVVPLEAPSAEPSVVPSEVPSVVPSEVPSEMPSEVPSEMPSVVPSEVPSMVPSVVPSEVPSVVPSEVPSAEPSVVPSEVPSVVPSVVPSAEPSVVPSEVPSAEPSVVPSEVPSAEPSVVLSEVPSVVPSEVPSEMPSVVPSVGPSVVPSEVPSVVPSEVPSEVPSLAPSASPTVEPSSSISNAPSVTPSTEPTQAPSVVPSATPTLTVAPSTIPSINPSQAPTFTVSPTNTPTSAPSVAPSNTASPSTTPSFAPSVEPTTSPTAVPSTVPYTNIQWDNTLYLKNLTASELDTKSQAAVCRAATSVLSLADEKCEFLSQERYDWRRRRLAPVGSFGVKCLVRIFASTGDFPETQYDKNGTALYTKLVTTLVTVVQTKQFNAVVREKAAELNGSVVLFVGDVNITALPFTVVVPNSAGDDDADLSDGALAGIIIGGFVFFMILLGCCYYYGNKNGNKVHATNKNNSSTGHSQQVNVVNNQSHNV